MDEHATGTEVDLSTGHIVLDVDPAVRESGTAAPPPSFRPCLLWPRSPISATAELLIVSYPVNKQSIDKQRDKQLVMKTVPRGGNNTVLQKRKTKTSMIIYCTAVNSRDMSFGEI